MQTWLLWMALQAQASEQKVCLPSSDGRHWQCMPAKQAPAWVLANPAQNQPARQPSNQSETQPVPATLAQQRAKPAPKNESANTIYKQPTIQPTKTRPSANQVPVQPAQASKTAKRPNASTRLSREQAINLLYKAPVTLPAQQGKPQLRRAPTTLDELQQLQKQGTRQAQPSTAPAQAAIRRTQPAKLADNTTTGQADQESHHPAVATPPKQNATASPAQQIPLPAWQVRLVGSASEQKLRKQLQQLPRELNPCTIQSSQLGTLQWWQIVCGPFPTRAQAQHWANQATLKQQGFYPAVIKKP